MIILDICKNYMGNHIYNYISALTRSFRYIHDLIYKS